MCIYNVFTCLQNSTLFVPSNVSIADYMDNRTLNLTWLSSNGVNNNSLLFKFPDEENNITGIIKAYLIEGELNVLS